MSPRYHADLVPVNATEDLIKHETDKMLSEETNDIAEHHVLIDSAVWFKIGWNPFDTTHERSGNPIVSICPIDTIYPQPGIINYKALEYIFEKTTMTVAQVKDLYNRNIKSPTENDIIPIINCYFLNENRYVGKFSWCEETATVICNDLEWGIRKRRVCADCGAISPIQDVCEICGSKSFKYEAVAEETLSEPLAFITNPYRVGDEASQEADKTQEDSTKELPPETVIPHYLIRQLPFVPYKRVSVPNSIYGISQVELVMEDQDIINKLLNKAERKSAKSKTYVTKLKDTNIDDSDDEIAFLEVESPQEGQAVQTKQIISDITQEVAQAQILYDIAKSTVGITNTDQGKSDASARSGKAKQLQMLASSQRNASPDTLRNLAYSGIYELIFKNFISIIVMKERSFCFKLITRWNSKEEVWSKYMFFLDRNKMEELYYSDDFAWSVDEATEY